jgi:hypothetical protein
MKGDGLLQAGELLGLAPGALPVIRRLRAVSERLEQVGPPFVRGGEVGLDPEGGPVGILGSRDVAPVLERDGQVEPDAGVVGVEPRSLAESPDRVVDTP